MPSPGCRPSWVLSGPKATCQLSCERTTIFGAPVVPEVSTAQAALSGSAASNAQVDTGARGTIISGTPPAARIFNAAVSRFGIWVMNWCELQVVLGHVGLYQMLVGRPDRAPW